MTSGVEGLTNAHMMGGVELTDDQLLVFRSLGTKVREKFGVKVDNLNIVTADDFDGDTCIYLVGGAPGEDGGRWFVLAEFPKATELHHAEDPECGCLGCRVGRDPVAFIHVCATRPPQGGIYEATILNAREGLHERVEIQRREPS